MTARTAVPAKASVMTKLLAIALVIVTILPIVVFATDFTNSGALRAARQNALRGRVRTREENPEARRERIRTQRAKIHPTLATATLSMGFQLVMLTVLAVVGRRLFALRL